MTTEIITEKFDVLRGRLVVVEVVMISQEFFRGRGSCYDFPGVDHEGRQTCRLRNLMLISMFIIHVLKLDRIFNLSVLLRFLYCLMSCTNFLVRVMRIFHTSV